VVVAGGSLKPFFASLDAMLRSLRLEIGISSHLDHFE
jgi:hypothetical protein